MTYTHATSLPSQTLSEYTIAYLLNTWVNVDHRRILSIDALEQGHVFIPQCLIEDGYREVYAINSKGTGARF